MNPGLRLELFNTYVPDAVVAGRPVRSGAELRQDREPARTGRTSRRGSASSTTCSATRRRRSRCTSGKYMRAFSTVGLRAGLQPERAADRSPHVVGPEWRRHRAGQRDRPGRDAVQHQRRQQPACPIPTSSVPTSGSTRVGVQRELIGGVLLSANWMRRDYKRLFWSDNMLTTFDDYTDRQHPEPDGPGGDAADLQPQRGQARPGGDHRQELRPRTAAGTTASTSASRRGRAAASLYGGVTAGKQTTVYCEVDDPNSLRFCDQRDLDMPYLYQFKLAGTYPLPYGIQLERQLAGLARRARGHRAAGCGVRRGPEPRARRVAQRRLQRDADADSDPHGGQHHGAADHAGRRSSSSAGTRSTCACRRR